MPKTGPETGPRRQQPADPRRRRPRPCFDYLVDLATDPVPVPVWLGVVAWCSPEQALGVGITARRVARFEVAEAAFEKAASADVPGATAALAEVIGSGHELGRAVDLVTEALRA